MKAVNKWYKSEKVFAKDVKDTREKLNKFIKEYNSKKGVLKYIEDVSVEIINIYYHVEKIEMYIEIIHMMDVKKAKKFKSKYVKGFLIKFYSTLNSFRSSYKRIPKKYQVNDNVKYFMEEIMTSEEYTLNEVIDHIDSDYNRMHDQVKTSITQSEKAQPFFDKLRLIKNVNKMLDSQGKGQWTKKNTNKNISISSVQELVDKSASMRDCVEQYCDKNKVKTYNSINAFTEVNIPEDTKVLHKLITNTFSILGENITLMVKDILENNVYYRTSGSFNAQYDVYECEPVIITSKPENLYELLSLVHEIGHAVHSKLGSENLSYVEYKTDTIIQETFSQFFEIFFLLRLKLFSFDDDLIDQEELNIFWNEYIIDGFYNRSMLISYENSIYNFDEDEFTIDTVTLIYNTVLNEYFPFLRSSERDEFRWIEECIVLDSHYNHCYLYSLTVAFKLAQDILSLKLSINDLKELMKSGSKARDSKVYKKITDNKELIQTIDGIFKSLKKA